MATNLPTNIDVTYADRSPGDKAHQQYHDQIHGYTNTHDGAVDPHPDYLLKTAASAAYVAKAGDVMTGVLRILQAAGLDALGTAETTDAAFRAVLTSSGTLRFGDGAGTYNLEILRSSGTIHLSVLGAGMKVGAGAVIPTVDDSLPLGQSSNRWKEVWSVNGVIQTSDRSEKADVDPVPGQAALERVKKVAEQATISYRWPDGTRRHAGFDADKVGEIHGEATAAFIDPSIEADRRVNPHDASDEPDEHAGFEAETAAMSEAPKGLRYTEMLPDLYAALAAQQTQIEALTARITALEAGR